MFLREVRDREMIEIVKTGLIGYRQSGKFVGVSTPGIQTLPPDTIIKQLVSAELRTVRLESRVRNHVLTCS